MWQLLLYSQSCSYCHWTVSPVYWSDYVLPCSQPEQLGIIYGIKSSFSLLYGSSFLGYGKYSFAYWIPHSLFRFFSVECVSATLLWELFANSCTYTMFLNNAHLHIPLHLLNSPPNLLFFLMHWVQFSAIWMCRGVGLYTGTYGHILGCTPENTGSPFQQLSAVSSSPVRSGDPCSLVQATHSCCELVAAMALSYYSGPSQPWALQIFAPFLKFFLSPGKGGVTWSHLRLSTPQSLILCLLTNLSSWNVLVSFLLLWGNIPAKET